MATIVFVDRGGQRREVDAPPGKTLLDVARAANIDIEGACEGSLACSTCHIVVEPAWYGRLEKPSEDEIYMLDLACGLTRTSRLGCQIVITEDLNGLVVMLPAATRDLRYG